MKSAGITSFTLMKNLISVSNPDTKNSSELFIDEDALQNDQLLEGYRENPNNL